MQKTYFNQTQKNSTFNSKRYSDQDLRVGKIDKLLITQASLLSQAQKLKIQTTNHNNTTAASHSYGKMGKLSETLAESEGSLRMLKEGLDSIKLQFSSQRTALHDRLEKTQQSLSNKVARLGEMVNYSLREAADRTERLNRDCQSLRSSSDNITHRLRQLKDKMRNLEHNMGVYTGQDKYLA